MSDVYVSSSVWCWEHELQLAVRTGLSGTSNGGSYLLTSADCGPQGERRCGRMRFSCLPAWSCNCTRGSGGVGFAPVFPYAKVQRTRGHRPFLSAESCCVVIPIGLPVHIACPTERARSSLPGGIEFSILGS